MAIQMLNPSDKSLESNNSKIFLNSKNNHLETVIKSVDDFTENNFYPGDLDIDSYEWITDAALYMNKIYNPDFMLLSYANPYYLSIQTPPGMLKWEEHLERLFFEVERFINQTDYIPIIIGTGGTYPLEGRIDLSYLEGQVNNWPGSVYASVYNAAPNDLKLLEKNYAIQMIVSRERLQVLTEETADKLPDYFLVARRGFALIDANINGIYRVNGRDPIIPVKAPYPLNNICHINKLVKNILNKSQKVAVIFLEGISCADFKWDYNPCSNTYSWFTYLPEEFQYLTIGTGLKFPKLHVFSRLYSNGGGFENYLKRHPLEVKTIGGKTNIKSAAIGSRRNLTHIASGADIVLECGY